MPEKLKPNIPFTPNPIGRKLPTTRANILHVFRQEKTVDYQLDPYYKGIKISPKILYRLQSAQVNFSMHGDGKKILNIMDGKFIMIDNEKIEQDFVTSPNDTKFIIKSCIKNPIYLNNPERKPYFYTYQNFDQKDYFFLSFLNPAINGLGQETFVLVSYKDGEGLQAKQIGHVQFATDTKTHLADIDGVPTLFVTHEEADSADEDGKPKYQHGEHQYTETFNLKNQERKIEKEYHEYA